MKTNLKTPVEEDTSGQKPGIRERWWMWFGYKVTDEFEVKASIQYPTQVFLQRVNLQELDRRTWAQLPPQGTLNWPRECPCCGDSSDDETHITIAHGKTLWLGTSEITSSVGWEVPYCKACIAHITASRETTSIYSKIFLTIPIIFAILAILFFAIFPDGDLSFILMGLFVSAGWFLVAHPLALRAARRHSQTQVIPNMKDGCHAMNEYAVSYRGWQDDLHTFRFKSQRFATLFANANGVNLVTKRSGIRRDY